MDADGARLDATSLQLLGCFGCGSAALGPSVASVVKKEEGASTIKERRFRMPQPLAGLI
jgi:ABC-type taurine transport system ATPase subunit